MPPWARSSSWVPRSRHSPRCITRIWSARRTVETMPPDGAAAIPEFQPLLAFQHLMLQKFGAWDSLAVLPLPDSTLGVGRAVAEYARGTSLAALGRYDEAEALLAAIGRRDDPAWTPIARNIVAVARHSLAGEIAARRRDWRGAERHFKEALAIEDSFTYMEPPWWIEPVRHPLGAMLLAAGRTAEAEAVFRADLDKFPKNVWSLTGLAASLAKQGKTDAAVTEALAEATRVAGRTITTAHP